MGYAGGVATDFGESRARVWPTAASYVRKDLIITWIHTELTFNRSSNQGLNKPPTEGANQTLPPFAPSANPGNQTGMLNSLSGAMVRPGMPGPLGQTMPLPSSLPQPVAQIPARPTNPDEPVVPTNGFATHEEAEKAFWYLLKKAGMTPELTWDNAIRALITDPLYKSFNSMAERKDSWQKVNRFTFTAQSVLTVSLVH
jgi:hypothetical protein